MNFNIYLRKETGERVTQIAHSLHRSRNSIVNEALEEWLSKHDASTWQKGFFDFSPVPEMPDFESLRSELKNNISEDPLK